MTTSPNPQDAGEWQDDNVVCRDHEHQDYWTADNVAETGSGYPTPEAEVAVRGCNRCPVREKCLDVAMEFESGFGIHRTGIWGGLLPRERARLHDKLQRRAS